MQVMPFWVKLIGAKDQNLFHMRTNLRYGCTILRHYVDIERGDLYRALGRYNGSLGQPQYPTIVVGAWRNGWMLNKPSRTVEASTAKHPG
jgi:soluble lytic murein transglycosylase-like protein